MRHIIFALALLLGAQSAQAIETGTANQVLRYPSSAPAGTRPTYGTVNLASSAAVVGTLPYNFGGTGQASTFNQYGACYATSTTALATTSAGTAGQVLVSNASSAPTYQPVDQGGMLWNMGLSATVATNALTIALKQSDGSTDPTSSAPVRIAMRSSTLTTASYLVRSVTGALSVVVPSSATLGLSSGSVAQYIHVYALDNAGTVELAVAGTETFEEGTTQTSTTISGSATSGTTLYSTTGRSNVPVRYLGRIKIAEATAGTYATAPTEVALAGHSSQRFFRARYSTTAGQSISNGSTAIVNFGTVTFDDRAAVTTGASWKFTAPIPCACHISTMVQYASASFSTGAETIQLFKNGSLYSLMARTPVQQAATYQSQVSGSDDIILASGDFIDVRTDHGEGTARSLSTTTGANYVSISCVGN